MTSPTPTRRRWFRFRLRTLFVLVTVLGVFLGWLGVQLKWIRDRHAAIEWVESINRRVLILSSLPNTMRWELGGTGIKRYPWNNAPWGLRLLGEAGVSVFSINSERVTPNDRALKRLPELRRLFPEAQVDFSPMPARDERVIGSPTTSL